MKKSATTNKRSKRSDAVGGAGKGELPRQDGAGQAGKTRGASGGEIRTGAAGPMRQDEEIHAHGRTIHNGSAGAFDATEHSHDEEDEDQDSDDFAMDR